MSSGKQVKIGAILSYLSIALNIVAGLIYTPWMINQIGKNQYGLYTLANSLITLFLIDFGLSSATSRYISKYRAEGKDEEIERFLGAIYKLYLIIDAIIFTVLFILFFFLENIYVKLTPQEMAQFKVVYIIAGLFSVVNFPFVTFNGILTSYEQFIPLKLADVIYRVLLVGLTVAALLLGQGLYALVGVHAIVGLLVVLYKFIVIKKTVPVKVRFQKTDKSLYKEIFGFSIWVTLTSLAQRLVFNITPSILGITASASAIAVFGVVSTIEGYVFTIASAINGMFLPRVSKEYATIKDNRNDMLGGKIQELFLKVGRFQYAINALMVVGFALLGQAFVNLWMGAGYQEAYIGVLLIIAPSMFINALQIVQTTMIVTNNVKVQAIINIITGLVNIVLSVILSSFMGVFGACLSICIAYITKAVLLNVIAQKTFKFDMKMFIKDCYLKMSVPCLLTLLVGVMLNYALPMVNWGYLILKGVIVTVVYLVLVYYLGLIKKERKALIDKIKR